MSLRSVFPSCSCALLFSMGCGAASDGLEGPISELPTTGGGSSAAELPVFPGAGTSGAAEPLVPGLGPDSTNQCDPEPPATPSSAQAVERVCFYAAGEPDVPAATIEQVVEVVGNTEWVHVRLILNPNFVDNSFGETAVGWGPDEADAPAMAPRADRTGRMAPRKPQKGAHTFKDLVGSDHAEIKLLDASGAVVLHFKLDYLSESASAPSGYASLGVSGGEGKVMVGDADLILGSSTSMDRNLNACGLADFVEDSPSTGEDYAPSAGAEDWDYRVIYEVWASAQAFGGAGFGSALIESVHASPSKTGENTETVTPGPCPPSPDAPNAEPEPVPPVLYEIR